MKEHGGILRKYKRNPARNACGVLFSNEKITGWQIQKVKEEVFNKKRLGKKQEPEKNRKKGSSES